jgi:hypothetical protein
MNKQDILKVLEEANKCYSNLTDKQIEQYNSEEFKKGIISGGKAAGNLTKELGIGIHNEENRNEWAKMGGKAMGTIQGKKNIESGLISNLGKINASKIHECPHCGKVGKSSSMFQWHFEKCKWKNNPKPIIEPKININKQIHTCPHCSKIIQGRNYFKWHGDKCKHKK